MHYPFPLMFHQNTNDSTGKVLSFSKGLFPVHTWDLRDPRTPQDKFAGKKKSGRKRNRDQPRCRRRGGGVVRKQTSN